MTIAWVTGGGTGIGRALAEALCRQGSRVIISGRRNLVLQETAEAIRDQFPGADVLAIAGDITTPGHAESVVEKARQKWGTIDFLVNNAGVNRNHQEEDTSLDEYEAHWKINCLGAIASTRAVLPGMRREQRGTIVNISSIFGRWSSDSSAAYSVAKHALAGYSEALRQSLLGTPIHVMTVFPGFIRTAMTLPFVQPGSLRSRFGKDPADLAKAILRAVRHRHLELYYPWYVSGVLRLHRWMPGLTDRWAKAVRNR